MDNVRERRSLAESKILIVLPNGPASQSMKLASFIQQHRRVKSASFTFINHPIPPAVLRETELVFQAGQGLPKRSVLPRERHIPVITPILDWFLTLLFLVRTHRRYDTCITQGIHLVLLGILLKSVGVVKQVVCTVQDYWPQRYTSSTLSRLYRLVFSWCFSHVDFVVDNTTTIAEARVRDGIRMDPAKQFVMREPIDPSEIGFLPQEQLKPDSLVWSGAVTPECGFELVIEAIELVARERPGVVLTVTSYEPFHKDLWKMVSEKRLEKHFQILGFIKEQAEFNKVVRKHRAGLAPYNPAVATSAKPYAGVARPWTYMKNGVPPIITRVVSVAKEIEEAGAGIVIEYEKEQLAEAILALLTDDQLHRRCRQKGLELAKSQAMERVFDDLLAKFGLFPDGYTRLASTDP